LLRCALAPELDAAHLLNMRTRESSRVGGSHPKCLMQCPNFSPGEEPTAESVAERLARLRPFDPPNDAPREAPLAAERKVVSFSDTPPSGTIPPCIVALALGIGDDLGSYADEVSVVRRERRRCRVPVLAVRD
jgi:hypothetical protein